MEDYVINEHTPQDNSKAYSKVKSEEGFGIEGHYETSSTMSQTFLAVDILFEWNFTQSRNMDIMVFNY